MGSGGTRKDKAQAKKLAVTHPTSLGGLGQGGNNQGSADHGLKIVLIELNISVVQKSQQGDTVAVNISTGKEVYVGSSQIGSIPERFREQVRNLGHTTGTIISINHEKSRVEIVL
jgi:hypothetical protein